MKATGTMFPIHPMFRRFIMTKSLVFALNSSVKSGRLWQVRRMVGQQLAVLGGTAISVVLLAAAPGIAIPVPPGVGAGSAAFSPAGGPRRPGPSAMSRRPMQIAAAQPPGCQGVIAVKGRQHRR
jgi:hypothetical protein